MRPDAWQAERRTRRGDSRECDRDHADAGNEHQRWPMHNGYTENGHGGKGVGRRLDPARVDSFKMRYDTGVYVNGVRGRAQSESPLERRGRDVDRGGVDRRRHKTDDDRRRMDARADRRYGEDFDVARRGLEEGADARDRGSNHRADEFEALRGTDVRDRGYKYRADDFANGRGGDVRDRGGHMRDRGNDFRERVDARDRAGEYRGDPRDRDGDLRDRPLDLRDRGTDVRERVGDHRARSDHRHRLEMRSPPARGGEIRDRDGWQRAYEPRTDNSFLLNGRRACSASPFRERLWHRDHADADWIRQHNENRDARSRSGRGVSRPFRPPPLREDHRERMRRAEQHNKERDFEQRPGCPHESEDRTVSPERVDGRKAIGEVREPAILRPRATKEVVNKQRRGQVIVNLWQLPSDLELDELLEIAEKYGTVLSHDLWPEGKQMCAKLEYETRDMAMLALEELNNRRMDGWHMLVKALVCD